MNKGHSNSYSSMYITYTSHWNFKDTYHFWSYIQECKGDRCLDCNFVNNSSELSSLLLQLVIAFLKWVWDDSSIYISKFEVIFLSQFLNFWPFSKVLEWLSVLSFKTFFAKKKIGFWSSKFIYLAHGIITHNYFIMPCLAYP